MLRRTLVAAALAALLIALAACGGGSGAKSTATKAAMRTATKQVTRAPATGTPVATWTPPASGTAEPSAQPTVAPPPTEPPAPVQPTDTPRPASGGTTVSVGLVEFSVVPAPDSAPPGTVTFDAQNNGTVQHDFLVIKTDLAESALPVDQTNLTVDTAHLDVLNQPSLIHTESSQQVTLNLTAGNYVLICNVVDHYLVGMHVSFTVQ